MVILNKLNRTTYGPFKTTLIETIIKITTLISEHLGLEQYNFSYL